MGKRKRLFIQHGWHNLGSALQSSKQKLAEDALDRYKASEQYQEDLKRLLEQKRNA